MTAQSVRDKKSVLRAQSVRDRKNLLRAQSVRDKEIVRPRPKDRVIDMYVKRHETGSRMKLEVKRVFSIVDTEFEQKSSNQNDQLYRLEPGEITQ